MSRQTCRRSSRALAIVTIPLLLSGRASAHSVLGVSRWWDGALHTILSPLAVAAIVGLAAAVCRLPAEKAVGSVFAASAAAFAGAAITPLPFSALTAPAGAVVAGLVAALALKPSFALAALFAAIVGFCAGVAASPDERLTIEMAAGAAFAVLVLGANLQFVLARLARLEGTVPRVLGAWCAAIGIMMGLLAFVH